MFLFLLIVIFTLLVIQYIKKLFYFKSRGLNSPIPLPFLGFSLEHYSGDFLDLNLRRRRKYGKNYGMFIGSYPIIVVGDPNIIKGVTQKNAQNFTDTQIVKNLNIKYFDKTFFVKKGKEWKEKRALVSPVFTTKRIKDIFPTIQKASIPLFENIENLIKEGKGDEIEIKDLLKGYSLDVIAKYVFALELNSAKDKNHPFVKAVRAFTDLSKQWKFALLGLLPLKVLNALKVEFFDVEALEYIANLCKFLIKERSEGNKNFNDFLSMYLETVKEKNLEINVDEIIGICIIFFFAGLDTVGTSICNVFLCLILNPECQEKLYNELISLYPNKEIDYDGLKNSPYLEACIKESQRLYPALTMTFRIAENPIEIDGFKIEANDAIAIDIMSLHRSEEYWTDSKTYKPERFLDNQKFNFDNIVDSESMLFLPFGSGPRSCIATRYALVQLKYAVAKIILNYEIYRNKKTAIPPKYLRGPNQLIYKDMYLGLRKRKN